MTRKFGRIENAQFLDFSSFGIKGSGKIEPDDAPLDEDDPGNSETTYLP